MTATAPSATRTNREGNPCPSWCVTDHADYAFHGTERTSVEAADYRTYHAIGLRFADGDKIAVQGPGQFYVSPEVAVDLANLIEKLGTASLKDHRALAAAIRQAAAQITDAGHA